MLFKKVSRKHWIECQDNKKTLFIVELLSVRDKTTRLVYYEFIEMDEIRTNDLSQMTTVLCKEYSTTGLVGTWITKNLFILKDRILKLPRSINYNIFGCNLIFVKSINTNIDLTDLLNY